MRHRFLYKDNPFVINDLIVTPLQNACVARQTQITIEREQPEGISTSRKRMVGADEQLAQLRMLIQTALDPSDLYSVYSTLKRSILQFNADIDRRCSPTESRSDIWTTGHWKDLACRGRSRRINSGCHSPQKR